MKKVVVIDKGNCAGCETCERACAKAYYKVDDPKLACIHFTEQEDGTYKNLVCIQCGKCARACPQEAITKNAKGVYMVNKKLCISCGACVRACPFGVMVLAPGSTASKCVACGICVRACPLSILAIQDK